MGDDPRAEGPAEPARDTPLDPATSADPDGWGDHHHVHLEHLHERLEHLEEAAIAAEMATGHREETVEEAKRGVVKRFLRMGAGVVVTAFGLLLLVLPGPGLLVVAAGLVILAQDVPFAARMLEKVRRRLPADADGKVPKGMVISGLAISVVAVAGSVWWTFLR